MPQHKSRYIKHAYWLSKAEIASFKAYAAKEGKKIYFARKRPCEVLFYRRELCICEAQVWSRDCSRQGSWYRESKKRGLYLVVSNEPIPGFEEQLESVIRIATFIPPRRASKKDVEELINDPEFTRKVPEDWDKVSDEERRNIRRYLDSRGINESVDEVFKFYSANHANFITPRFYVEEDGKQVPYSIADEPFLCSACVELFGILPVKSGKGYLMKCAGLFYVDLSDDEYLVVEHIKRD